MDRVRLPLFLLRIGVFIVMLMWTLDKFVRPGHAAGIFKKFYGIDGISPTVFYVIGALELLLLVGFVTGPPSATPTVWCCSFTQSRRSRPISNIWRRSTICFSSPRGRCWPRASRCTCFGIWIRSGPCRRCRRARIPVRRKVYDGVFLAPLNVYPCLVLVALGGAFGRRMFSWVAYAGK